MIRQYMLLYLLFFSSAACAWTINADFENGSIGAKAQGSDAFSESFRDSIYTNKVVQSGSKAVQLKINQGTNGWGQWGGVFTYPSVLHEGDEIWFRASLYFPAGFNFQAAGQGIKTMRIHTASSNRANEGYFDALIRNAINIGSEVDPNFYTNTPSWDDRNNLGPSVTTGSWITLEQYVKFSSTRGVYRVWRDGKLIFEDLISKTMRTSSSISDYIYLFTYWNGDAPATQNAYADNIIITNQKPSNADSHGNPYIGVGSFTFVAPPKPPTIN